MQFVAKTKYVQFSPYKLRPVVDVVRGKNVRHALDWLKTCRFKKAEPIVKMLSSAVANAKFLRDIDPQRLAIKEICVDQGPAFKSYTPGSMGRAVLQKRRYSHMKVVLESIDQKEV